MSRRSQRTIPVTSRGSLESTPGLGGQSVLDRKPFRAVPSMTAAAGDHQLHAPKKPPGCGEWRGSELHINNHGPYGWNVLPLERLRMDGRAVTHDLSQKLSNDAMRVPDEQRAMLAARRLIKKVPMTASTKRPMQRGRWKSRDAFGSLKRMESGPALGRMLGR